MIKLLESYSASEIVMFIVILCFALKESVTFIDWARMRINQGINKNLKEEREKDNLQKEMMTMNDFFSEKEKRFEKKKAEIYKRFDSIENQMNLLQTQMKLLIDSDKDDIKSYIVDKHRQYCYYNKAIDDYTLDCLERRFEHYQKEGGNSYVENLMEDLRGLTKKPPTLQ